MASLTKTARSLDSLEEEIRQLRQKARQLEEKIDDNFTYFQEHSGSMFIRSLLPRKIEGETLTGSKKENENKVDRYAHMIRFSALKLRPIKP